MCTSASGTSDSASDNVSISASTGAGAGAGVGVSRRSSTNWGGGSWSGGSDAPNKFWLDFGILLKQAKQTYVAEPETICGMLVVPEDVTVKVLETESPATIANV